MPERGQWRLTDLQRFLAVLTVIAALFLAAMALGMGSAVMGLVAVALLVTAGLAVFLLGLFYNGRGGVRGTAEVQSASPAPVHNIRGRCDLRLLVHMEGRAPVMMKHRDPAVPVHKWPDVGMILPVEVPTDKPGQLRILWDRVPDVASRAPSPGGPVDTPTPAEPEVPVYTQYAEELRAPGLAYDYFIEDSPTPPWPGGSTQTRPVDPFDTRPAGAARPETVAAPDAVPAAREDPAQLHVDGLDLADLDLDDLNDLDLDDLDLDDLSLDDPSLDDPGPNRSDPDGALEGDTVEARTVTPDQKTGGAGPMPPGPRSALPTRGTARPGAVPAPRTEHGPRTDPVAPVDAEVVDDSTGGPGGFDPTGMDVMLIVSSLKASLAFYEGMLHMPVLDQTEGTAVLSSGGGRIILQQMAEMSPVERRVMHLQLRVRNVEAVYHELRRRGVTFAHRPRVVWPTDRDEVTVATCRDPDGHAVSLTEWRVRSTGSSSD